MSGRGQDGVPAWVLKKNPGLDHLSKVSTSIGFLKV